MLLMPLRSLAPLMRLMRYTVSAATIQMPRCRHIFMPPLRYMLLQRRRRLFTLLRCCFSLMLYAAL